MYHMSQYHPPKISLRKMDDMTQSCVDIASLKTLYENPKGKKLIQEKDCNMMLSASY